VYVSTDNGKSWTAIRNGLTDFSVNAIIFSGSYLFAGTRHSGIFLSTNNGASWTIDTMV